MKNRYAEASIHSTQHGKVRLARRLNQNPQPPPVIPDSAWSTVKSPEPKYDGGFVRNLIRLGAPGELIQWAGPLQFDEAWDRCPKDKRWQVLILLAAPKWLPDASREWPGVADIDKTALTDVEYLGRSSDDYRLACRLMAEHFPRGYFNPSVK